MSHSTARSSLWTKREKGPSKTRSFFMANCAAHVDETRPAIAKRQDRIRAIWVNAALWTFQGWLAMFYAGASLAKLTAPPAHLEILLGWSQHVSLQFVMAVGIVEAILALGMLVPVVGWSIGRPVLTLSALGMLLIQIVVGIYHAAHADVGNVIVNLFLAAMTASILMFKCARQAP